MTITIYARGTVKDGEHQEIKQVIHTSDDFGKPGFKSKGFDVNQGAKEMGMDMYGDKFIRAEVSNTNTSEKRK